MVLMNAWGILPFCSVGSEIKTYLAATPGRGAYYLFALLGARSKPLLPFGGVDEIITFLLCWERDQNTIETASITSGGLPFCSVGSEIKTGVDIALSVFTNYLFALLGARSKHVLSEYCAVHRITFLLCWERDQNIRNLG